MFEKMWKESLLGYLEMKGINWEWQSMDSTMTKTRLGGKSTGPNPTDKVKSGTKRNILVDGYGVPIGLAVAGANRHDMKLAEPTLERSSYRDPNPRRSIRITLASTRDSISP